MHCLLIMMLSHSDTSSASFSRSLPKHIHFFRFEFWLWFKNYFGACRSSVRNVYTDAHRVIKVLCLCMVAWTRWSTFSGFKSYFCCSHFPQITKTNIQHAMFNSILYALLDLLVVTSLLCVAGCPRTNAGTSKIALKKCFLSDYQNVSTPYRFLRYIIHLWQQNWECFSDEMMLLREEQGWTHA